MLYATIAPRIFCRKQVLYVEGFEDGLVSRLLFWWPIDYLPMSKTLEYMHEGSIRH